MVKYKYSVVSSSCYARVRAVHVMQGGGGKFIGM